MEGGKEGGKEDNSSSPSSLCCHMSITLKFLARGRETQTHPKGQKGDLSAVQVKEGSQISFVKWEAAVDQINPKSNNFPLFFQVN